MLNIIIDRMTYMFSCFVSVLSQFIADFKTTYRKGFPFAKDQNQFLSSHRKFLSEFYHR